MSNDLLKQIDDLVASKTFNLEALDGIKALKDSLSKTLTTVDYLQEKKQALEKEVADLKATNYLQAGMIESRNKKLEEGEATLAKANYALSEADKHKAVADAYKDALYTVFKPNAVRENIHHNMPVMVTQNGNSYPQTVQHQQTITREDA